MPVIKNGQYGDIILRKEHTGYHKDVVLKNKYFRYRGDYAYVKWSGVEYIINPVALHDKSMYDYTSTGYQFSPEVKEYQIPYRRFPLLWRKGYHELRILKEGLLGYDFDAGRVLNLYLDRNGILTTGTVEVVGGEVAKVALKWLKSQKM